MQFIPYIFKLITATFAYKILHAFLDFALYLSSDSHSYSTKRSQSVGNFLVPKCHSSTQKIFQFGYSFAFDAPTVWNALPDEIHVPSSVASLAYLVQGSVFVSISIPFKLETYWSSSYTTSIQQ